MGFALLLPAALAALAALALPLLLHLARRSEQRPTPFAALRWLRQKPRPRQRLRIEDWPLLLVRLLLLALLALWLAQPVWRDTRPPSRVIAIAPGIDVASLAGPEQGVERRWLAGGFPLLDAAVPAPAADPSATLPSLLRELDADLPADVALTVMVPAVLDRVDAQRIVLGRAVDWRVVGPATTDDAPSAPADPPALAIRHDGTRPEALRILRAVALAWHPDATPSTLDVAESEALPAPGVPLAWWRAGPLPDAVRSWIGQGGSVLLPDDAEVAAPDAWTPLWRDAGGEVTLEVAPLGAGRVLRVTQPLAPATLPDTLDGEFPRRLLSALRPQLAPARVEADDHAPTVDAALAGLPREAAHRDLRPWLALLVALVFALERWLATARRRSVGA